MKIDNLKPGTLLTWDAPEPHPGYAQSIGMMTDRIIYPVKVIVRDKYNSWAIEMLIGAHMHKLVLKDDYPFLRERRPEDERLFQAVPAA